MRQYTYGWECLHNAVRVLVGPGTLNERLINAVIYYVCNIDPVKDLPADIREEFRMFMRDMKSATAPGDKGVIQATVERLDEVGVSQAIDKIVDFYAAVCCHMRPY